MADPKAEIDKHRENIAAFALKLKEKFPDITLHAFIMALDGKVTKMN